MERPSEDSTVPGALVRVEFVRHRNALLVRADFAELFTDYYLHLNEHGIRLDSWQDHRLKEGIVAIALHAASRPHQEILAWTVNFQQPGLNLFLGADNEDFSVVGRAFAENVRELEHQILHSEVVRRRKESRRSSVNFEGESPLRAAEALYRQSEQRPAKYFHTGGDAYALLLEHPDCDASWFREMDGQRILTIDADETVVGIEKRVYRWECGCSDVKLMRVLAPQMRANADELFAGEEILQVQCPRCAARYALTREAMGAWMCEEAKKQSK